MAAASAKVSGFVRGSPVRVAQQPRAPRLPTRARSPPKAKYGEQDQYFDLNDLENTLGSWDMYGQEDEKRYPDLQNEFFERAGESLTRKETLRSLIFLLGGSAILLWGAKGARDVDLPIIKGPQTSGEKGPKGKL